MVLMEDVPPRDLLITKTNTSRRNIMNFMNIAASLAAALAALFISEMFVRVDVGSRLFWLAIATLILSVGLEGVFVVTTRTRAAPA